MLDEPLQANLFASFLAIAVIPIFTITCVREVDHDGGGWEKLRSGGAAGAA